MTNFSANFLTNCSFGEQFANLNELYIWYARTEQLCCKLQNTVEMYFKYKYKIQSSECILNTKYKNTMMYFKYVFQILVFEILHSTGLCL